MRDQEKNTNEAQWVAGLPCNFWIADLDRRLYNYM